MAPEQTNTNQLQLPPAVIGRREVNRLLREAEVIDQYLHQASLQPPGHGAAQLPHLSPLLDELTAVNRLNLLETEPRTRLIGYLTELATSAPVVHISFAANPSAVFLHRLMVWLRTNIHPQLLVQVGLEPAIAAGCVIRTTNKVFDFGLRAYFEQQRELLVTQLMETTGL